MNDEKEYYTVYETADRFSVSAKTVYNWIEKGLPVATRREIGKKEHTVICPKDVNDFLRPGIVKDADKMNTAEQ